MQNNAQFAAIKWIKKELQVSIKQGGSLLEGMQSQIDKEGLAKFETIFKTLASNLEMANDEVGSILCVELAQAASYIAAENTDTSVSELMHGTVVLNDHVENISHGLKVDSEAVRNTIDELRERQGKAQIQVSLLFGLDLSSVDTLGDKDDDDSQLRELAEKTRPDFQRRLLEWFQNKNQESALDDLAHITQSVAESSNIELIKLYFTATSIVLEEILSSNIVDGKEVKMLVGQAGKQLKVLCAEGELRLAMGLPLRLVRQTLYYVAQSDAEDVRVSDLQEKYQLKSYLSDNRDSGNSIHAIQALGSIATAVREEFKNIKAWLQDIVEHDKPFLSLVKKRCQMKLRTLCVA